MGKNLKGKECGKGICQRKGKYAARYTAKDGSRREKHFDTFPEARNWLPIPKGITGNGIE